jgi:hypothetical protein
MESAQCTLCNSRGHHADQCPELRDPLREGFYSGGGGGGGGGGGDDDEHLNIYSHIPNKDDRRIAIHMGVFSNTHRRRVCSHVFQEFQISSIVNKIRC